MSIYRRGISWYYDFWFNGIRYRRSLGPVSKATARAQERKRRVEVGVNMRTIQRWLGHSSLRMTERYTHPSHEHEREAIRVLDRTRNPPQDAPMALEPWSG